MFWVRLACLISLKAIFFAVALTPFTVPGLGISAANAQFGIFFPGVRFRGGYSRGRRSRGRGRSSRRRGRGNDEPPTASAPAGSVSPPSASSSSSSGSSGKIKGTSD